MSILSSVAHKIIVNQAVNFSIRLLCLLLLASPLAGCQTMQGWFKPQTCDCATAQAETNAQTCGAAQREAGGEGGQVDPDEAMASCVEASGQAYDQALAEVAEDEELIEEVDEEAPRLRTLSRAREASKSSRDRGGEPLELVDPTIKEAGVDAAFAQQNFNISVDKSAGEMAFYGEFAPVSGEELMVVRPGGEVAAYGSSGRIARMEFPGEPAPQAFAELGLKLSPDGASAVELVKDGTLQLLMHWREAGEDGKFEYRVGVFKVTGPFIAKVFTRVVATSDAVDGPLTRQGTYEILRGDENRLIRWIPADDGGKLLVNNAELLEWNRWEGMYRVPASPVAGPKRDKLHSYLLIDDYFSSDTHLF